MVVSFLDALLYQPEPPPAIKFMANQLLPVVNMWLSIPSFRDKRRFLEMHPELLTPAASYALRQIMAASNGNSERMLMVYAHTVILRDIFARAGSVPPVIAIRSAFVNLYGGLMLEMPPWLENMARQAQSLAMQGPPPQTALQRLRLLEGANAQAANDFTVAQEVRAELQNLLGLTLIEIPGQPPSAITKAMQAHKAALQVYTQAQYPYQYAKTNAHLGQLYYGAMQENRSAQIEQALTCYHTALRIWTINAYPLDHASLLINLGEVYNNRLEGDKAENQERAADYIAQALKVFTHDLLPLQWAMAQYGLGETCTSRITGKRDENLRQAVDYFQAALEVFNRQAAPQQWATTNNDLGVAYLNLAAFQKAPAAMLKQALACFQNAQLIYTQADFPLQWANIQMNMGLVHSALASPQQPGEAEQAISCYNAALQVFTKQDTAPLWATCRINLGDAYLKRGTGDHQQNIDEAIACYESAAEVFTRQEHPAEWAKIQEGIGEIYRLRSEGSNSAFVEQAIARFNAALQVFTREQYPLEWANIQYDLGNAYIERIAGEKQDNIEQALAYYNAALEVRTRSDYPQLWAMTQCNLSNAWSERIKGEARDNLEQAITCAQDALSVATQDENPLVWGLANQNLSYAYWKRIAGERRDNLEQAITYCQAAMQVFTREEQPAQWGKIQLNLGNIYWERIEGEKRANIESGIAACEAGLQVLTRENNPFEWSRLHMTLGNLYNERIEGQRRENIEQALEHYNMALGVTTYETNPVEWANIQLNLGNIYRLRVEGERRNNMELDIAASEQALRVYTREANAYRWALIQRNLAAAYSERLEGELSDNQEQAIEHDRAALEVFTRDGNPLEWALCQLNLGNFYMWRIAGNRGENVETGIAACAASMEVLTRDGHPIEWAMNQLNLGNLCMARVSGERQANIREAIMHFQSALEVDTREADPVAWATVMTGLGNANLSLALSGEQDDALQPALDSLRAALEVRTLAAFPYEHRLLQEMVAQAEGQRQNWQAVHDACSAVYEAEKLLLQLGAGIQGQDIVLRESFGVSEADGVALARLGRIEEAILAVERGRAHGLSQALLLDAARPERIQDPARRERYRAAQQQLKATQNALDDAAVRALPESERRATMLARTAAYQQARQAFDQVVDEIRAARDPARFLVEELDAETILRAAAVGGPGHALVYLLSTQWGGMACTVLNADQQLPCDKRFVALELPELTHMFVVSLVDRRIGTRDNRNVITGGYAYAQRESTSPEPGDMDKTWHQMTEELAAQCAAAGQNSTVLQAAKEVLEQYPFLAGIVDTPLKQVEPSYMLSILLNNMQDIFARLEIQYCFEKLAGVIGHALIDWLQQQRVTSMTLIPCGLLADFPLAALSIDEQRTIADCIPASAAPSARSLLREDDADSAKARSGVYAVGDTLPDRPLEWGEAEALAVVETARRSGLPAEVKLHEEATREWLAARLNTGLVVSASCHGEFLDSDYLQSCLLLAKGERLTLEDMLHGQVDMRGLRLLVLSACQTAIPDLQGAIDEVHSLATGMLQAGARAVLASLWPVDDRATYLLMTRFAQAWLPYMGKISPAEALARAQSWLRTITNRQLQAWQTLYLPALSTPTDPPAGSAQTSPQTDTTTSAAPTEPPAARGNRGNRYTIATADEKTQATAAKLDPDACPYAHPVYWAGFQISGW